MIEANAQIICRKEDYGEVCQWEGPKNGIARLYGECIVRTTGEKRITRGQVVTYGRLRLRVIQFPMFESSAWASDCAAVMLESPHAQLYQLYREKAEKIVRFVRRCELAVLAFREELREGQRLEFTAKIADLLL